MCALRRVSKGSRAIPISQLTELGGPLAINGCAGPIVRPSDVSVLSEGNHGLDGEGHARFALANRLVLRVVRNVRRAVEELSNAMAAVGSNYTAVLLLGMLLDDVAKLSDQGAGLDGLDRLIQALSCSLNNADIIGVGLGLVANVVCLVQIRMVTLVIYRNINVENIAIQKHTLIGNTVADDFVHRGTAGLGEMVVVEWRRVRL